MLGQASKLSVRGTMAGAVDKRFYRIWTHMKTRCTNEKYIRYHAYGGRGIVVCERWQKFKNFRDDMYQAYIESGSSLSLDRIDCNGNYEPSNCRWATPKQQANNMRCNRIVEYRGISKPLSQWISDLGLKPSTVRQRYYCYHWDIERCFEYKGVTHIGG
jgi:hypothetical protein